MENFLRSKEYWQVVSEDIQEPKDVTAVKKVQTKEFEGLRLKDLKTKKLSFSSN